MFLSGKNLPRRVVLRGLGVGVTLPFLDAMIPAGVVFAQTPAAKVAARTRLVCIEQVHGAAGCSEYGIAQNLWSPAATGRLISTARRLTGSSRSPCGGVMPAAISRGCALLRPAAVS